MCFLLIGLVRLFSLIFTAPATAEAVSTCPKLLEKTTASSGVIRSNYKSLYGSSVDCNWTLSVSSDATLELVFWKLSTEVSFDVVHVYDGGSTSSALIGSYSGASVPAAVTSSSNQLLRVVQYTRLDTSREWYQSTRTSRTSGDLHMISGT